MRGIQTRQLQSSVRTTPVPINDNTCVMIQPNVSRWVLVLGVDVLWVQLSMEHSKQQATNNHRTENLGAPRLYLINVISVLKVIELEIIQFY